MRMIFYLVAALLLASLSCNQKPKAVQEKENVVRDSIRIPKSPEEFESYLQSYMESLRNAQMKFAEKDYKGAIADYTKIIENPSIFSGDGGPLGVFILRGIARDSLKDYKGAIDDYTKAIEKSTRNDAEPYIKRGLSKSSLKDYEGAIDDFTKCLEFDPNNLWIYYYRGLVKIESGDKNGGCEDLKIAADRNASNTKEAIKKYCQ